MSYALELKDIRKNFGKTEIIRGINLAVNAGERIAIIGPNGAGKSTLFNIILGKDQPDEGLIEWERGANFGFLPQESAPVGDETILQIATSGGKLPWRSTSSFWLELVTSTIPSARCASA